MIKVGITGGIGSGKTTICKIFETLGINCYYADNKAKNIINQKEVSDKILSYFGDIIYYNGTLNKIKLRDIVFNNPEKLDILNNIIHPYVFKDFENWLNLQNNSKYILIESAIIYSTGLWKKLDKIIYIYCNDIIRKQRIIETRDINEKTFNKIIKIQKKEEPIIDKADFIIYNDENKSVLESILNIDKSLKELKY